MTIPERLMFYLRKPYLMEYNIKHELIIKEPIKTTDLVKLRGYLKRHNIDYKNIIVEIVGGKRK